MDRFVTREQRNQGEYPQGNQMIAFSATTSSTANNITIPENMHYGGYGGGVQNANMQQLGTNRLATPHVQAYSPNVIQAQGQFPSGIDPRYLAPYVDNNAIYAQSMHGNSMPSPTTFNTFGSDYQHREFAGALKNKRIINYIPTDNHNFNSADPNNPNINRGQVNYESFVVAPATNPNFNGANANNHNFNKIGANTINAAETNNNSNRVQVYNQSFKGQENRRINVTGTNVQRFNAAEGNNQNFKGSEKNDSYVPHAMPTVASKKQPEIDLLKHELQNQVKTRAEKLKELQKSGTRIFSGPVEKILKWHKSIQDIGVMVLYEIVGKCVNVRAGVTCAKILVVRDENGPAIQVVYYEIDFFLPELKPPCTVRVIGRMLPGTNRCHAFNVRLATGDDVATLPRRAAVAAHHVANLCKDYGVEVLMLK